jgi:Tol biopolymer transport system component
MIWLSEDGVITPLAAPAREYNAPRISPDGKQICVTIGPGYGAGDIWRFDIARQTLTRLTFDGKCLVSYWLPDGRSIVYQSEAAAFSVATLSLDGDAAPHDIIGKSPPIVITGTTPDGRWVIYGPWGTHDADIFRVPTEGGPSQSVVSEPLDQADASVSPDGAWIAYASRPAGTPDVFVRPFPSGTNKWQLSTGGGVMPRWSPTKKEIYWISGTALYAASYETSGRSISFGNSRRLFDLPPGRGIDADVCPYDITPDGTRFLMTRIARPEFARRRIDVILDFDRQLKSLEKKGISQ